MDVYIDVWFGWGWETLVRPELPGIGLVTPIDRAVPGQKIKQNGSETDMEMLEKHFQVSM